MTTIAGYPATIKLLSNGELNTLGVHKIAQAFPAIVGDDRKELLFSMRRSGYDESQPIVCWAETGEIIDGRNRRDAAHELGLRDVPVAAVGFPDAEAVVEYVRKQNLARRHMTPKDRAKAGAKLVKESGMSVREAAEATGASKSSVQRSASHERSSAVPGGTAPTTEAKSKPVAERHEDAQVRLSSPQVIEQIEQATEKLHELVEARLTPAALRKIDTAVKRLVRAADRVREGSTEKPAA